MKTTIKTVTKRDGRIQPFDEARIHNAILKAMRFSTDGLGPDKALADALTAQVCDTADHICMTLGKDTLPVDRIHDLVEKALMRSSRPEAAQEYIRYREKRNLARKADSRAIFDSIIQAQANDITRENANMNADTPAGMMMKFASESTKTYVDECLLPDDVKAAVKGNYLHIHDKDYYPTKSLTCLVGETAVTIKDRSGNVRHTTLDFFDKFFHGSPTVRPDNAKVGEFLWILGRNGWTRVEAVSRHKVGPTEKLYKIRTRKGPGLKATGDHLVPVFRDGSESIVRISDLRVGDELIGASVFDNDLSESGYVNLIDAFLMCDRIDRGEIFIANIRKLRLYLKYRYDVSSLHDYLKSDTYRRGNDYITLDDYDRLTTEFVIPQEVIETLSVKLAEGKDRLPVLLPVDEHFATVLGYIHSEGSISINETKHAYQVAFCNFNKDVNLRFKEAFEKVFPNTLVQTRNTDGKQSGYHFSSKLIAFLFSDVIGRFKNSFGVEIPDCIFRAGDDVKWSYLSALIDGDGCLTDKRKITFTTVCESFASQISLLLKEMGIASQVQQLHSAGTTARFGDRTVVRSGDTFNVVITGYENIGKFCENLTGVKNRSLDDFYASKPLKGIHNDPNKVIDILEIEKNGRVVYDLQTAEHWFTANGIIVHNCIQHPTDKLLREGFVDGHASVRPAKRIETAATVACITMEAVQNEMHGGQAIPAFDFYMAPYVRMAYEEEVRRVVAEQVICPFPGDVEALALAMEIKDYVARDWKPVTNLCTDEGRSRAYAQMVSQIAVNRTVKRVHQAMESFVHNMNTIHSRGGNQVVFSSINYGTDTSAEGRCVIRELLNTTYEGVGNGETAIFPIQIWKKKRGVSYLPGDPNYDLYRFACKVTARRFFPNYLNLDASYNVDDAWRADDPKRYLHEVATMGCRTRVYADRFGMKTSVGRGNLSFSTVNIVRIAIEAMLAFPGEDARQERIAAFFSKFDEVLDVTARQLHQRYEFQRSALAKQFPMLMSGMWAGSEDLKPGDPVGDVLKHGTLSIGFIGLAECLIALVGKHHGESEEAQQLGLRIVGHMAEKVRGYADQYDLNYTLLATPAEGLSGRFTKIDRKEFGSIPGVTDKDYYTNSSHVPVYYKCTPEHKARIEGPYHGWENAGHIFYVEMDGDATHNPQAIMAVVDLMDKYDIGYGSVNHNRNRCLDCGYESAEKGLTVCPRCGGTHVDTLQRITGYLVGTTERWNSGKKAELKDRVVHE